MGFEINPYSKCVVNKLIEGTQCTIAWYVDDIKLSYKNPEVISDIINEVKKHFGELSIVRGRNHTFLGTNTEIKDSMVQVDTVEQLERCIEIFVEDIITSVTSFVTNKFGEDVIALVTSPATKKLFEVREYSEKLSENKGKLFHSVVWPIPSLRKIALLQEM